MKAFLVIYCLVAEALLVLAVPESSSDKLEKRLSDQSIDDIDFPLDEVSPDSQRKRDPGYYYNKPNRFPPSNYFPSSRHGYRGRIVTKLHSQVNRPFNQYGPPNHGSSSLNHKRPGITSSLFNQEVPIPVRQTEFVEESPIASQNSLPFGQHTANYLPPKNQKLPMLTPPNLFSNQNHDFPKQHQQLQQQQFNQVQEQLHFNQVQEQQQFSQEQEQQQYHQVQQQQQFNQVQEPQQQQQYFNQLQQQQQHFNQVQQQQLQLQIDQNSFQQDFNVPSFNQQQNANNNQQISDAALFLSQNAQAISELYGAPANDQNYAPFNQEFHQGQHQSQSQNLQIQTENYPQQLHNQQLPSYSSGVLNSQQSLENVKSLEKDRLISQLQLELSNRENAARFVQNNEDFRSSQNEDSIPSISLFPPRNRPYKYGHVGTSFNQPGSVSSPSSTVGSSGFQGFYPPPVPAPPTTEAPVLATPSPPVSSTFQPSQGSTESGSTQIGTSLPTPGSLKPGTTSAFPQYGGFVPTFVPTASFLPSFPTYGTTSFPTTPSKPSDNSPTHFGIPIPTLPEERPVHPPTRPPSPSKPANIPLHPGISTVSIPLGPVHHFPSRPQIIKPSPVPVVPAATPVHPTYGLHPAVINPSFVYKPVKVYPVYYYPHLYSSPPRKSVYSTAGSHPWSYAPSYAQAKPIWK